MYDDVIRNIILEVEKIRYACVGSSATDECMIYVSPRKEMMLIHAGRAIFYTTLNMIDGYVPEFAFVYNNIPILEDKSLDLSNLFNIGVGDLRILTICKEKYQQYIAYKPSVIASDDLNHNESFTNIMSMKSTDGLGSFQVVSNMGNIIRIPYFVGLFKIKKTEKYHINVYDYDTSHYLVEIINSKPKIGDIKILFFIMKV